MTTDVYQDGNTFFTKGKDGKLYAVVCLEENKQLPSEVSWRHNLPPNGTPIKLLMNGKEVKWKKQGERVRIFLPAEIQRTGSNPALVFSFTPGSN